MRSVRSWLIPAVVFLVTLALVWTASLLLHELGHGLTARVLGGNIAWLRVWPGIEAWPSPGQAVEGEWGTAIMRLAYTRGPGWGTDGWRDGVVRLMGSGTNLLLAALALGSLWLFRPRGWLRLLLIAQALMFADLLLYCTLPEFLGLPHYLVFGGSIAEPVDGAASLGCPRWGFILFAVLVSALMMWGLVAYVRRERMRDRRVEVGTPASDGTPVGGDR
jgi:hypothetical protein